MCYTKYISFTKMKKGTTMGVEQRKKVAQTIQRREKTGNMVNDFCLFTDDQSIIDIFKLKGFNDRWKFVVHDDTVNNIHSSKIMVIDLKNYDFNNGFVAYSFGLYRPRIIIGKLDGSVPIYEENMIFSAETRAELTEKLTLLYKNKKYRDKYV